jgi:S-adenosylmethionine hydrolase
MKVIALLTDFGLEDNFVGVMKGVILCINPCVQLVDITHNISSHNIKEAALVLLKSFSYFPRGTVFLTVVDPGVGSSRIPIGIKTKNYYFVGPDNGTLSLAAKEDGIKAIIALENKRYLLKNISSTFQARDIFAPVAANITKGVSFSYLGRGIKKIKEIDLNLPKIKGNILKAEIIYADKFGNLVTDIKKDSFNKFLKGNGFIAHFRGKKIKKLYSYYMQAKNNEPFLIEGSFSFLEISLKNKSAKDYFSLERIKNDKLIIKRLNRCNS